MKLYFSIIAALVLGTAQAQTVPVTQGTQDRITRDQYIVLDLNPGLTAQTWFYFDSRHQDNRLASLVEVECATGSYRVLHNREYRSGQLAHDTGLDTQAPWQVTKPGSVTQRFRTICPQTPT